MVMTIGELHAGHCINTSLADVVSERNEIRCVERLRTWNWEASMAAQSHEEVL
jgi:hypothetical protein